MSERRRLAELEDRLRRHDRSFASRIEATARALLPRSVGPAPLDDQPRRIRHTSPPDRRTVPTVREAPAQQAECSRAGHRPHGWPVWLHILGVGSAMLLVGIGLGATTRTGALLSFITAGVLVGVVVFPYVVSLARGFARAPGIIVRRVPARIHLRIPARRPCRRWWVRRRDQHWQHGAL